MLAQTRIQMCGHLVAQIGGRRVDDRLPGRQGRLLFAYLIVNRTRRARRDELVEALWPAGPPAAPDAALRALLSKLRSALGEGVVQGRDTVRICLPADAFVDLEAAHAAIHRAESALAQSQWAAAWGPAQVALFTSRREFLGDESGAWIEEQRRALDDLHLRALEAYGIACLRIGGTEVPAAERTGRALTRLAPYRESGHRLLIEALVEEGNLAEALRTYESLRELLRSELGIAPSPEMRALHSELLG